MDDLILSVCILIATVGTTVVVLTLNGYIP